MDQRTAGKSSHLAGHSQQAGNSMETSFYGSQNMPYNTDQDACSDMRDDPLFYSLFDDSYSYFPEANDSFPTDPDLDDSMQTQSGVGNASILENSQQLTSEELMNSQKLHNSSSQPQRYDADPEKPPDDRLPRSWNAHVGEKRQLSTDKEQDQRSKGKGNAHHHPPTRARMESQSAPDPQVESSRSNRGKQARDRAKQKQKFHCAEHNRNFGSSSDYKRHFQDMHEKDPNGNPIKVFECEYDNCHHVFRRLKNLLNHIEAKHGGQHPPTQVEEAGTQPSTVTTLSGFTTENTSYTEASIETIQPRASTPIVRPTVFDENAGEKSAARKIFVQKQLRALEKEIIHRGAELIQILEEEHQRLLAKVEELRKREQSFKRLVDQPSDDSQQAAFDREQVKKAHEKHMDYVRRVVTAHRELAAAKHRYRYSWAYQPHVPVSIGQNVEVREA